MVATQPEEAFFGAPFHRPAATEASAASAFDRFGVGMDVDDVFADVAAFDAAAAAEEPFHHGAGGNGGAGDWGEEENAASSSESAAAAALATPGRRSVYLFYSRLCFLVRTLFPYAQV